MRPIRLTLEGFTSFRQKAEIDFAGLDLFAITGPTGSGKTSILDAITYALYGQTSRLGGRGLGELISLGAPRLSVMLDFESSGMRYRVARVLKRNGPALVRFETLEGDGQHPVDGGAREIAAQIARIVGLEFDAFTKAVVLPQGQFDQFLRGDPAQRRQILEALLNLGVYREMMQRANARQKEQQTERDLINSQLEREYADATEANSHKLASEIERLAGDIALANAELKRVEDVHSPAIELRQKRDVAVNAERERKITAEDFARERSKHSMLAGQIEKQEQDVQRLERELQEVPYDEARHQNLIALLPIARQFEKTERDHGARVQEMSQKSLDLEGIEKSLQAARQNHQDASEKSRATEEAHAETKEKFSALREKYGSVDMVNHVASEMERLADIEQQLQRDQEEYASLEKKQTELASKIDRLAVEEVESQRAYSEAQERYEALFQRHFAEELRNHLKAGEPCPVCEQVVTRLPKRIPAAHLDQARAAAKRCEQALHKAQQDVANARAELAGLPRQLQTAKLAVTRTTKQIKELKDKAERILGKVPGTDASCKLKRVAADLRAAESLCVSKEKEAKTAAEAAADAKDAVVRFERDAAVLRQEIESLSNQIEAASREIERLHRSIGTAGNVKAIEADLGAQQRAKQQRSQIEAKIKERRKTREEALKELGNAATQVAVLKDRISGLEKTVERATAEAGQIERQVRKKLEGLALPEGADEAERIENLLLTLRAHGRELSRQMDQSRLRLEQIEIRIREAEKKRARIADLEHSALVYAQLGTLLRADQFIGFILEDAFQLLCDEGARQLLALSQGRYSFHTDDNEFQVIDHWNADERRSVRTLSGGESFLASLALALALSASVSQFSGGGPFKLDTLFLDEGFSTLDAETLTVAIEALQALQQGDRMLGVISHVTDLAERLPSRIQVIKGISGSEIKLDQEIAAATP
jgi:exonuclease SbcC